MAYRALKGTKDVTPNEAHIWHHLESTMRSVTARFGLREIRTPVIEQTELFLRGVGDTTDIVQKEMYTFKDKGDRSITLKPEGTAGAVRAFIEHNLYNDALPQKMYYLNCPVFRYERPQAGRLREHHQFGVEVFGSESAYTDAEIISLALTVLREVGIDDLSVNINSIGCSECRPKYHEALKAYFAPHLDEMCPLCKDRFERNPLRLLDCKEEKCKAIAAGAPRMIDYLCPDCDDHFNKLQSALSALSIPYAIDSGIVRGLDYYTKTVFEIISNRIGAQGTVCGGGRYDKLMEMVGGPSLPGVGFGMGMERLIILLESYQKLPEANGRCDVYCLCMGDGEGSLTLANRLRQRGIRADFDPTVRSMKAQMRYAEKLGAKLVAIVGEDEKAKGVVLLRNMATREQTEVSLDGLSDAILKQL
ncbi:MAG: histidine--tRNA ligase [Clostridiales bacterium]|nr:histidine--tRNA ligase [Clostridiales bacterium]